MTPDEISRAIGAHGLDAHPILKELEQFRFELWLKSPSELDCALWPNIRRVLPSVAGVVAPEIRALLPEDQT